MAEPENRPVLFVLPTCPFCLKLRLFLLEAGMLGGVEVREADTPESDAAIRAELAPHFDKVTFPTLRLPSGEYLADSDAIIAHFAEPAGINPGSLPTYRAYVHGPLANMKKLFAENMQLKKELA